MGPIKNNGDGTLNIPKWFILVVGILIFFITTTGSIVATQTTVNNDVTQNKQDIKEIEQIIKNHDKSISEIKRSTAVTNAKLNKIQENVEYIKERIK